MNDKLAVYLDSSAIVKLIVPEPESQGLSEYLDGRRPFVSSALALVEVLRAVRPHGASAYRLAREVLDDMGLLEMDSALLEEAADLDDELLRTLDAIHLASASALGDDLSEVVTYDQRMIAAATLRGLPVSSP